MSEWYIDLYISCPAYDCNNKTRGQWYHSKNKCNSYPSKIQISTKANVKCEYCNNPHHLSTSTFSCEDHKEFRGIGKLMTFTRAINLARRLEDMNPHFCSNLNDHLDNEQEEGIWKS
ncbi:unnamed protein product [Rhizophagus irregularis]|nr:unnamed protein product [Rhizophagus irregularis]CAB4440699.1 unnamed protein product [Rhizophagus irregularis]